MFRTASSDRGSQESVAGARSRRNSPARELPRAEEGFTLAALIVVLTIIAIVIAYTVPTQWSLVMKRERDRHTVFLMKQYARAISNWDAKHKSLPVSLDQLQKARKPRMIRGTGEWPMPLTGNAKDWILVPPTAVANAGAAVGGQPGGVGGNPAGGVRVGAQQPAPGQPGSATTRLNKEASPKDYVGPFVGVRPNATGKSFIALNGAEDYSEWVYTVFDLRNEMAARQMALTVK